MDNLLDIASSWINQYHAWQYLILMVGFLLQNEIALILTIYMILNHSLGWSGYFFVVFFSIIIYEGFFYALGRILSGTRLGNKIERKIPNSAKLQFHLHKNATFYLILSKFVMYMNSGTLFLSGWTKMDFWKFSKHRAIANLIWITIMTPLAYFLLSGLSLLHAAKILGRLEIGIVLILILGFGAKHFIKKMLTTEAKIEAIAEKVDEKIK